MGNLVSLKIENFRGIKRLHLNFSHNQRLICIIGRGDSGKSTVLEAISCLLSQVHTTSFSDYDFYDCDPKQFPICLEATIVNFHERLISENKYGLYARSYCVETRQILDDITEITYGVIPALSIKLYVDQNLEPKWVITNGRDQDDISISASDRSLFQCSMVSDYIDRHFSWNKGTPLFSLLKALEDKSKPSEQQSIVLDSIREAKSKIDSQEFLQFKHATDHIISKAVSLGLSIESSKTTIDFKDIAVQEGKVSLHDGAIPFRQKGKGTKRLTSLAIQSLLVESGGILLIDEIEQGLEPDRIKQLARNLNEQGEGQIFITTHSRDAIVEFGSEPLLLLIKNKYTNEIKVEKINPKNEDLQKTIRACPEAFFARKVIVCEGATEVGICRSLDSWRHQKKGKPPMSFNDCAYIDGTGSTLAQRVEEINEVGLTTALLCDSDLPAINNLKEGWRRSGIAIFDCDENLCLEQQIFQDLPWDGVLELLNVAQNQNVDSFKKTFESLDCSDLSLWIDSEETRSIIKDSFKPSKDGKCKRDWFKNVHQGEVAGNIILKYIDNMGERVKLKTCINLLDAWIDESNS